MFQSLQISRSLLILSKSHSACYWDLHNRKLKFSKCSIYPPKLKTPTAVQYPLSFCPPLPNPHPSPGTSPEPVLLLLPQLHVSLHHLQDVFCLIVRQARQVQLPPHLSWLRQLSEGAAPGEEGRGGAGGRGWDDPVGRGRGRGVWREREKGGRTWRAPLTLGPVNDKTDFRARAL